jgi:hypothetical protein
MHFINEGFEERIRHNKVPIGLFFRYIYPSRWIDATAEE